MAHLADNDDRCVLIEDLINCHHLAKLHQCLDDLGRLDRHFVRQLRDRDGLWHRDVAHHCFDRHRRCRGTVGILVTILLAIAARTAPASSTAGRITTGFQ